MNDGNAAWNRNGEDARYIARGVHEGRFDPGDFNAFLTQHRDWLHRYQRRNLRRNWAAAVRRWQKYIQLGIGNYPDDFVRSVTGGEVPLNNRGRFGGQGINPGNGNEDDEDEDDEDLGEPFFPAPGQGQQAPGQGQGRQQAPGRGQQAPGRGQGQQQAPGRGQEGQQAPGQEADAGAEDPIAEGLREAFARTRISSKMRAGAIVLENVLTRDQESRSLIMVWLQTLSGIDVNEVEFELTDNHQGVRISYCLPAALIDAYVMLGALGRGNDVLVAATQRALDQNYLSSSQNAFGRIVEEEVVRLPHRVEPRFREVATLAPRYDPVQIVQSTIPSESAGDAVFAIAFLLVAEDPRSPPPHRRRDRMGGRGAGAGRGHPVGGGGRRRGRSASPAPGPRVVPPGGGRGGP